MQISRKPVPALRPFVKLLWASQGHSRSRAARERLIPDGGTHLVFRLSEEPIHIFGTVDDRKGHRFKRGVVGGTRSGFYVKGISNAAPTVGATFQPGASPFGVTADELAERHTAIEDLWGGAAHTIWERLGEEADLHSRLEILEQVLIERMSQAPRIHPAVAHALSRFPLGIAIGEIVETTGYSHRRFIELFRRSIGLSPRLYTRVLRFRRAHELISRKTSWIDTALCAGYSDQAHFNREFREFTGVTPTAYLSVCPQGSLHVPILAEN